MQILIGPINMPIRHTEEEVLCAAQEIVRLHCVLAADFWIYKQSLDARRKGNIHYVYQVAAFRDKEDADRLRKTLNGHGMRARVIKSGKVQLVLVMLRGTERDVILRHWLGEPETIDSVRAWLDYFDNKLGSGLMKKVMHTLRRA